MSVYKSTCTAKTQVQDFNNEMGSSDQQTTVTYLYKIEAIFLSKTCNSFDVNPPTFHALTAQDIKKHNDSVYFSGPKTE